MPISQFIRESIKYEIQTKKNQKTHFEFYFISCSPIFDDMDSKRLKKMTQDGQTVYKSRANIDEWFKFLINVVKRLRVFHKGKQNMEQEAERTKPVSDGNIGVGERPSDPRWDSVFNCMDSDDRKQLYQDYDILLKKFAPLAAERDGNEWLTYMTDDNFDTKLKELVHDNGPSDGLVEEILTDKNVGIPGMGSQLASYSKIARIMYYLTYQFTNVNSDAVGKKYKDEIIGFEPLSSGHYRVQIKETDVGEVFLDKLVSLSNRGKEIEPNLRKKYLELYEYLKIGRAHV